MLDEASAQADGEEDKDMCQTCQALMHGRETEFFPAPWACPPKLQKLLVRTLVRSYCNVSGLLLYIFDSPKQFWKHLLMCLPAFELRQMRVCGCGWPHLPVPCAAMHIGHGVVEEAVSAFRSHTQRIERLRYVSEDNFSLDEEERIALWYDIAEATATGVQAQAFRSHIAELGVPSPLSTEEQALIMDSCKSVLSAGCEPFDVELWPHFKAMAKAPSSNALALVWKRLPKSSRDVLRIEDFVADVCERVEAASSDDETVWALRALYKNEAAAALRSLAKTCCAGVKVGREDDVHSILSFHSRLKVRWWLRIRSTQQQRLYRSPILRSIQRAVTKLCGPSDAETAHSGTPERTVFARVSEFVQLHQRTLMHEGLIHVSARLRHQLAAHSRLHRTMPLSSQVEELLRALLQDRARSSQDACVDVAFRRCFDSTGSHVEKDALKAATVAIEAWVLSQLLGTLKGLSPIEEEYISSLVVHLRNAANALTECMVKCRVVVTNALSGSMFKVIEGCDIGRARVQVLRQRIQDALLIEGKPSIVIEFMNASGARLQDDCLVQSVNDVQPSLPVARTPPRKANTRLFIVRIESDFNVARGKARDLEACRTKLLLSILSAMRPRS
eukprot:TRINITY_DN6774_c1_g2_i1.p1 TRINITY_DN6774_c1_g2~~TRINITY_DN6774_c1_g2_i1.p1  ORF type:complete len:616 (+),score=56.62 TRINITY_DN6774_c1_g2_i1:72-1919(+)